MSADVVFVALAAVAGVVVGYGMRPTLREFDTSAPAGVYEVVTAALFAVAATRYDDWRLIPILLLMATSVALSAVDLAHYRLPDKILFPGFLATLGVIVVGEIIDGDVSFIWAALVGMAFYCVVLFVLHVVNPAGLGFGDVKLALLLGLVIGWSALTKLNSVRAVMFALLIGSTLGVVLGVVRIAVLKFGGSLLPDPLDAEPLENDEATDSWRDTTFPFGPPLMIGAMALALWPVTFLG